MKRISKVLSHSCALSLVAMLMIACGGAAESRDSGEDETDRTEEGMKSVPCGGNCTQSEYCDPSDDGASWMDMCCWGSREDGNCRFATD